MKEKIQVTFVLNYDSVDKNALEELSKSHDTYVYDGLLNEMLPLSERLRCGGLYGPNRFKVMIFIDFDSMAEVGEYLCKMESTGFEKISISKINIPVVQFQYA